MKIWRMAARVGSMSRTPNSGMTFSVTVTGLPPASRREAASSAAWRLPATTTGQVTEQAARLAALCTITSSLPPSVPPASSTMSGARSAIRATSAAVSL